MKKKDLEDLSWNVTEDVYRADRSFSYSKLASFYKNGPSSLISDLFESTKSVVFGSLVDCILTTPKEFDNKFIVSDIAISEKVKSIIDSIYECRPDVESIDEVEVDLLKLIFDALRPFKLTKELLLIISTQFDNAGWIKFERPFKLVIEESSLKNNPSHETKFCKKFKFGNCGLFWIKTP